MHIAYLWRRCTLHTTGFSQKGGSVQHSLNLLFLGLFPMYWAYQPWNLTFFRMQFFNFFSMICTRSTRMKNRPYWMVKISPEHGEKSRKIIDLKGVGLIRPFENTLYISWFVLFYPDFYHNLLPSSGHDPIWEQAAAGPQQEAHPHHERAAGVQTGRRH